MNITVKICGIKSLEDAANAINAGAEFLGFNFVSSSQRYISPDVAKEIIDKIKAQAKIVGIFQDVDIHEVNKIVKSLGLDFVQLHGEENGEYCKEIKALVIKKITLQKTLQETEFLMNTYKDTVDIFLVDRPVQGEGPIVDLKQVRKLTEKFPIMLAGGLSPTNIVSVLTKVGKHLYGLDVNSGVENSSGKKDKELIRDFIGKTHAVEMDIHDPLQKYKEEFYLLKDKIYMDGNSLGLFSKRAEKSLSDIVNSYKSLGIDSFTKGENPFFYLAEKLGKMSAPLIGALPEEVVIAGSTTVNIHQLLTTFFKPNGKRKKILTDEFAFPTDIYAIKSQLLLHGLDPKENLVVVQSKDGSIISEDDIIAQMSKEVALILLPVVFYKSGQLLNIEKLVKEAHKRNILIGFDACHSVGVIPHEFHKENVDFAVFCTYKYLNGGPGCPAGLFVHTRHFGKIPGIAGWFGSDKQKQFDMEADLTPAAGAGAYQMGTPHILSMAPLIGSLELFKEVGISAIRKKSLKLTSYMIELVDGELADFDFSLETPREVSKRGGHIALAHKDAASICKALKEHGVIPDFRAPNVIRLAPSPFYTSFYDVYETLMKLKYIMETQKYKQFTNEREVVA